MKKPPTPFPALSKELDKQGIRSAHHRADFHYNGHCPAHQVSRVRPRSGQVPHQSGNASIGRRTGDSNFRTMIEVAVKYQKPVRIGVNWGSLDQRSCSPA